MEELREFKRAKKTDNSHLLNKFEPTLKGPSWDKNMKHFGKLGGKVYDASKEGLKVAADVADTAAPALSVVANIVAPGSGLAITAAHQGLKAANDMAQNVDGAVQTVKEVH